MDLNVGTRVKVKAGYAENAGRTGTITQKREDHEGKPTWDVKFDDNGKTTRMKEEALQPLEV